MPSPTVCCAPAWSLVGPSRTPHGGLWGGNPVLLVSTWCCLRGHGRAQQLLGDAYVCRGPGPDAQVLVSGLLVQSRVALWQRVICVLSPHPPLPQLPSISAAVRSAFHPAVSPRASFRLQILGLGCGCCDSFCPHHPDPVGFPSRLVLSGSASCPLVTGAFWKAVLIWWHEKTVPPYVSFSPPPASRGLDHTYGSELIWPLMGVWLWEGRMGPCPSVVCDIHMCAHS